MAKTKPRTLLQGIWIDDDAASPEDRITTYYRSTRAEIVTAESAVELLRGYVKGTVPDVIVTYQDSRRCREWRKDYDYGEDW